MQIPRETPIRIPIMNKTAPIKTQKLMTVVRICVKVCCLISVVGSSFDKVEAESSESDD